jgi:phospholipid-binding lipoprotein MlaA
VPARGPLAPWGVYPIDFTSLFHSNASPGRRALLVAALALALLAPAVGGAAEPDPLLDEDESAAPALSGFPDPLEPFNRATLKLNQGLDVCIFDPLTRAYRFVVPNAARRAVRRMLANLDAPAVAVNDVLQLSPRDAGTMAARFVVNTTVGVVGLFDVAEHLGLEEHSSDFGQTLALYGIPSGPFLVLPVAGPTTVRDGTGYLVDILFHPTSYIFTPAFTVVTTGIQGSTAGIVARDVHGDEIRALQASSLDYYAALRSAFYQHRTAEIWARREEWRPVTVVAQR